MQAQSSFSAQVSAAVAAFKQAKVDSDFAQSQLVSFLLSLPVEVRVEAAKLAAS